MAGCDPGTVAEEPWSYMRSELAALNLHELCIGIIGIQSATSSHVGWS